MQAFHPVTNEDRRLGEPRGAAHSSADTNQGIMSADGKIGFCQTNLYSSQMSGLELFSEEWGKSGPPKAYGFVANIHAAFMRNVVGFAQAERVTDVVHHRHFDDHRA